jgi:hypothetical protein
MPEENKALIAEETIISKVIRVSACPVEFVK